MGMCTLLFNWRWMLSCRTFVISLDSGVWKYAPSILRWVLYQASEATIRFSPINLPVVDHSVLARHLKHAHIVLGTKKHMFILEAVVLCFVVWLIYLFDSVNFSMVWLEVFWKLPYWWCTIGIMSILLCLLCCVTHLLQLSHFFFVGHWFSDFVVVRYSHQFMKAIPETGTLLDS